MQEIVDQQIEFADVKETSKEFKMNVIEQQLKALLDDKAEWFCERCNIIHPNTTISGRVYQPSPDCGDAMSLASFNLRVIKRLRAQNTKLVEALEKIVIEGNTYRVGNLPLSTNVATIADAVLKENENV